LKEVEYNEKNRVIKKANQRYCGTAV